MGGAAHRYAICFIDQQDLTAQLNGLAALGVVGNGVYVDCGTGPFAPTFQCVTRVLDCKVNYGAGPAQDALSVWFPCPAESASAGHCVHRRVSPLIADNGVSLRASGHRGLGSVPR
jgi:hypothetical protein